MPRRNPTNQQTHTNVQFVVMTVCVNSSVVRTCKLYSMKVVQCVKIKT